MAKVGMSEDIGLPGRSAAVDIDCAPQDVSTPAVILGCFRQAGIGIVRSLGRLGVRVYAIDTDRFEAAFFSRYCRGSFRWDIERSSSSESLQFLMRVADRIGRRSVLIPTSDIGAIFLEAHAEKLAERFLFPDQTQGLVRSLCSKSEMRDIAKRCNIPTPETSVPASRDDVLSYLSTARLPILVKPIYNNFAANGTRPWRMFLAHSEQELLERYEVIENPLNPNIILQEYIPGPDSATWTFNGYFDGKSRCLAGFTGRKLRNYPPYFGRASLAICEHNEDVSRAAVEFMKCVGYKGPLDIGFRYDSRDGQYKVNDVNPRVGSMFRLFVGSNGIDIVRAMYGDLTDQPVTATLPSDRRKWIVEDVDWLSAIRYWRDGNLTLRDWGRSLYGIRETTFLATDDPLPLAAVMIQNLKRALTEGFRFVKSKLKRGGDATAVLSVPDRSDLHSK